MSRKIQRTESITEMPMTMGVVILAIVFALFGGDAEGSPKTSCELTSYQKSVVSLSYSMGEPYSVGESMVAIALQESELGKYNISLNDPSAGYHHVLVKHALKDLGWKDTPFNRNRAAQMMLDNKIWSSGLALRELKWWLNYHKGDYKKTWSSYNGGFKGNEGYAELIAKHIHHIRMCKWLEGMN